MTGRKGRHIMKPGIKFVLATAFIISLLQIDLLAAEIICRDTADVSIDEWYPDENLNYEDVITVATNQNVHHGIARALFFFAVPDDLTVAAIKDAKIYFSGCSECGGGKGGPVAFYALNEPFDENTDTWNSLDGGDYDESIYSPAVLPEGNDWNEAVNGDPPADAVGFDVTRLLKRNLAKVRKNGIMLRFYDEHQDPYTHQTIASRESENPLDFAPYLEISTREDITCPAEVIFSDSHEKIEALRRLRDQKLAKTETGRYIITLYYRAAPFVSSFLAIDPNVRVGARTIADVLLPSIYILF